MAADCRSRGIFLTSVGQSIVFTGLIYPDETLAARAIYAVGDLVDLAVSMFERRACFGPDVLEDQGIFDVRIGAKSVQAITVCRHQES